MDEDEGLDFAVRGVVRDGQVVIESPLDVPDGTFVTITPYRNGDVPELMEWHPLTEEQRRWFQEDFKYLRALAAKRAGANGSGQDAA